MDPTDIKSPFTRPAARTAAQGGMVFLYRQATLCPVSVGLSGLLLLL